MESPNPVPLPTSLVVKNGSNRCSRFSVGDSFPVIADINPKVLAGPSCPNLQVAWPVVGDTNLHFSASWHRLDGVDQQIGQHLLQLAGIRLQSRVGGCSTNRSEQLLFSAIGVISSMVWRISCTNPSTLRCGVLRRAKSSKLTDDRGDPVRFALDDRWRSRGPVRP